MLKEDIDQIADDVVAIIKVEIASLKASQAEFGLSSEDVKRLNSLVNSVSKLIETNNNTRADKDYQAKLIESAIKVLNEHK